MQIKRPLRIIIDTNLWISFIITKKYTLLDSYLFSKEAILLFSEELIDEINQTIQKPKLKKIFGKEALEEMLSRFDPFIELIEVKSTIDVCRDPNDNFLLELSKDGRADFLLTGDKDLLDLRKFDKTKITTISSFFDDTKKEK
ncbi:MAG: putative toxin-antitoxin system toxin component, PIN family [Ginsengibacter sp.]|jgi:hypothetical protein